MHSAHTLLGTSADFLDTGQAAKYLDLKPTTLEAWRCRGGGPRFVKMGRLVKYRRSDLDAFIESRLRSNTSEVAS